MQVEIKAEKIQKEDVCATVEIKKEKIVVKVMFKDGTCVISCCNSLEEILQTIGNAIYENNSNKIPIKKEA